MTDKQQSIFFCLIVFLFTCGAGLLVYKQYDAYFQEKTKTDLEAAILPVKKTSAPTILADGRLRVDGPKEGDAVGRTFKVSGYAQGWFEGNISIKVFDASSTLLYQGNAIAGDNYDHPAPFNLSITLTATSTTPTGKIEFNDYSAKDGSLVYQKVIDIKFADYATSAVVVGWKIYKNTQFGFELNYPTGWKVSSGQDQSHTSYIEFSSPGSGRPLVSVEVAHIIDPGVLNTIEIGKYSSFMLPNGIVAKRELAGSGTQKIQWILFDNNYFVTIIFAYDYASLNGKMMTESDYTIYTPEEQTIIDGVLSTLKFNW